MTTQNQLLEETVTTEEWEQALEVIYKQAAELDRLRALLRRWVDASVWDMTDLERETKKVLE